MPSFTLEQLFGDDTEAHLVNAAGAKVAPSAVVAGGKMLGIYFSAHWCPPCRRFTPTLAKFYKHMNSTGRSLQIVFASSCRTEEQFTEYLAEMPWLALPWGDARKAKLDHLFPHQGIPHLVFLDESLNVVNTDAIGLVSADPTGSMMPWRLSDILAGAELAGSDSKTAVFDDLKSNEAVGFYFSSKDCGGSRAFTPVLIKAYNAVRAAGKRFEIVSCALDATAAGHAEHVRTMPWMSLAHGDPRIRLLIALFEVPGTPSLTIIDPKECKVITVHGREAVNRDKTGQQFPWVPELVAPLGTGADINSSAQLLYLLDEADDVDVADAGLAAVRKVAQQLKAGWDSKGEEAPLTFAYADDDNLMVPDVRAFFKLERAARPTLLISDIPSEVKYVYTGKTFTEANIRGFVDAFLNKSLPAQPIQ